MRKTINSFKVKAKVLSSAMTNCIFEPEIDGWKMTTNSVMCEYEKKFLDNSTHEEWLCSIDDLRRILLACFLIDYSPRMIESFEIEGLDGDNLLAATLIFGHNRYPRVSNEESALHAFNISGFIFNGFAQSDPNIPTDADEVVNWVNILRKSPILFANLQMIQHSFAMNNNFMNNLSFYDPIMLLNMIVLLVSGLEGIFLNENNENSDLVFKFSTIGAIYYDRYATNEFLSKFRDDLQKFPRKDFSELLKEIYRLRSFVAHGSYSKLAKIDRWEKILKLKSVGYNKDDNIQQRLRSVSLAFGLFQKHIFALVAGSKENLTMGFRIMDEVVFTY